MVVVYDGSPVCLCVCVCMIAYVCGSAYHKVDVRTIGKITIGHFLLLQGGGGCCKN